MPLVVRLVISTLWMPLLLLGLSALAKNPTNGWVLLNVGAFPLLYSFSIGLHEAGHLFVARLLRLRVPVVQLGIGRPLFRFKLGATTLHWNAFPLIGLTGMGSDRESGLRWRLVLAVAAGPAATALVLGCISLMARLTGFEIEFAGRILSSEVAVVELLWFINVVLLIGNLLPVPAKWTSGCTTDGMKILTLPFSSRAALSEHVAVVPVLEAGELREQGKHQEAREVLERALQAHPGLFALRSSFAITQMDLGEFAEARKAFIAPIGEAKTEAYRALMRNNLAWVDFRLRDEELKEEADSQSEAAYLKLKGALAVLGTRGAVLTWLGHYEAAIPVLESAYTRESSRKARAVAASTLVVALAGLKRLQQAENWLARARVNDPQCDMLGAAEAAIREEGSTRRVPDN